MAIINPITVTGDPGGVFTMTPDPGAIDANTGDMDTTLMTPGTEYTVTYTVTSACGEEVQNDTFVYCEKPDPTFTFPTPVCDTSDSEVPDSITTAGGTFTIDNMGTINSATGEIDPSFIGQGTFNITYTVGGTGLCVDCTDSHTVQVVVQEGPDASFTVADVCHPE